LPEASFAFRFTTSNSQFRGPESLRPVQIGDLIAAAARLRIVLPGDRAEAARQLLDTAEMADRYRLATARLHPEFGNGSLYAAALPPGHDVPAAASSDPDFLHALATICQELLSRRQGNDGCRSSEA
jgi:hypothetical protein